MSSDKFLHEVEIFLRSRNISATRFGVLAAGDTKFVRTLRQGRRPREATRQSVRAFMRDYKVRR
jgi:hypothetical protein